jgi:hypothetical protein
MKNRTKSEGEIQGRIVDAIRGFFTSSNGGLALKFEEYDLAEPQSGAQTSKVTSFGRKPFDVGVFSSKTPVFFLEIKERTNTGKIENEDQAQQSSLVELCDYGLLIRYAYNGTPFQRRTDPSLTLQDTFLRKPLEMQWKINPADKLPSVSLQKFLQSITGSTCVIGELLQADASLFDDLNAMPLIVLSGLNTKQAKLILYRNVGDRLKYMKTLVELPPIHRQAVLDGIADPDEIAAIKFIFDITDGQNTISKPGMKP